MMAGAAFSWLEHVVDARGLVLPRVAARPIREPERRQVERDDAKAGRGQRRRGVPPQFAPRRGAVEQHDGNAVGGPFSCTNTPPELVGTRWPRRRRQFGARAGFADRRGQPEGDDDQHEQQQQRQTRLLPDQRRMVEITRPRRNGSIKWQTGTGLRLTQIRRDGKYAGMISARLTTAEKLRVTAPTACAGRARRRAPDGSALRADSPAC